MVFFRTAHQNANADSFSVVYNLLNTAALFNLCDDVKHMVEHGHQYSKQVWKDKVWAQAWELEDVYWQIQNM